MNVRIELNEQKIRQKVTNDRFGLTVSTEWKRLLDPYTPQREGFLVGAKGASVELKPWAIHYKEPYAAYQYNGEVYVNPNTNMGGQLTDEGWKSERKIKKVPSGRKLQYNRNESRYATDHWDIKAAENGQLNKLYRTLNEGLQSGRF